MDAFEDAIGDHFGGLAGVPPPENQAINADTFAARSQSDHVVVVAGLERLQARRGDQAPTDVAAAARRARAPRCPHPRPARPALERLPPQSVCHDHHLDPYTTLLGSASAP